MRHLPTAMLICLLLAACGDDAATPAANDERAQANTDAAVAAAGEPAPEEPALPPLPDGDFRIASVTLGREVDDEGRVREPLETFGTSDRIHAAVVGVGRSEGLTLSARWTTEDGTEVARAGQSLAPEAPTVTTFAISQPGAWPVGGYQVEISINDRVVETVPFRVE
jgi:hypothetical protein